MVAPRHRRSALSISSRSVRINVEMPYWTQRESVRADLRRKVRRLLAMYGYPPDLSEDATQLVLKQAELSTEYAK
jgi:hypothetical protein